MKEGYFDDRMSLAGRQFSRIEDRGQWLDGEVVTPQGIVSVYSEDGLSRLDVVHDGALHMRNFGRGLTKLGLTRAAAKFAREIAGAKR